MKERIVRLDNFWLGFISLILVLFVSLLFYSLFLFLILGGLWGWLFFVKKPKLPLIEIKIYGD